MQLQLAESDFAENTVHFVFSRQHIFQRDLIVEMRLCFHHGKEFFEFFSGLCFLDFMHEVGIQLH